VRLLRVSGLLAPLVFATAVIAATQHFPAFSHSRNFISELGATGAPGASLMNFAGFLPYGLLILAFAWVLHRSIRPDPGGWVGPATLAIYGLGYVALSIAPCDPGCQSATPSLHHRMHFLLGDVIVLSAVVAPFTFYSRLSKDPAWRSLAVATLLLPALAWLILDVSGVGVPGAIRQRIWLLLIFIWIELLAVRLLKLARIGVAPAAAVGLMLIAGTAEGQEPARKPVVSLTGGLGNTLGGFGTGLEYYLANTRVSASVGVGYWPVESCSSTFSGAAALRGFTGGRHHRGFLEGSYSLVQVECGLDSDQIDRNYGLGISAGYRYISGGGFTFTAGAGVGAAGAGNGSEPLILLSLGYTWRR
jgi:hypothetical membrane protein